METNDTNHNYENEGDEGQTPLSVKPGTPMIKESEFKH
jgi:hypothetical protein